MATELMGLTEYQKLLNAVESYYGAGSDQWLTIASQSNIQSTEWAQILSQTPNVNVITNNAGEVVSYTVNESFGTAVDSASAVINSNTQAATMTQAAKVSVPANTTVSQTGTVVANSGMKTAASGTAVKTVVKDVALGVAAVACGIRAGTKLSELIYTHGSYIWGEDVMSAYNPQTWDTLCETQNGKNIFNMVFGIDKTTEKTQAYIDQNAYAYILGYLSSLGAFDTNGETVEDFDPSVSGLTLYYNNYSYPYNVITLPTTIPDYRDSLGYGLNVNITSSTSDILCAYAGASGFSNNGQFVAISENPFSLTFTKASDGTVWSNRNATQATVDGYTYYYVNYGYDWTIGPYGPISPIIVLDGGYDATNANGDIYKLFFKNNDIVQSGGVEGITPQTGATLPTGITSTMTIPEILTYLQTLYPDMFDDAIYNDVVQPDGTVKRYTYVPVGFPDGFTYDQTTGDIQPTGGEGTSQADPTIDPTNTPVSLIDTLLQILESTDPYNPTTPPDDVTTDYPTTGGGTTPPFVIPTGSASALYSVYNPSQAQLNSLGAWLWSSNFVDQLLKLFNDPMQAIIGLHKVFATPPISGSGTIKVGYLDSGVGANLVSAQYTEVDCGTVQLKEYFGNALDYIKTDVYMYLPFVGIVPLNVEDVTRATIGVKYKVDVLTGACLATVNVTRDNNAGGQLYAYAGNCAVQYPLSSGSYMGIVASALGIAGSIAGTVLSGGAMLPMALGVGASALNSAKTRVEHSGSLSGNSGAMGIKKPYLIIRRPQTKIADNYPLLAGGSDNTYGVLSSFTGHTRVKYVHIENIPATSEELNEIETLLKSGVMI